MNRNLLYLLIAGLFQFVFFSVATAQSLSQRKHINFDDNWKFCLGHAADPSSDFNYRTVNIFSKSGKAEGTAIETKFKDSAWRTIQLPHDWAVELPFENSPNADVMSHGYKPIGAAWPQNSIGWYRKHFSIPHTDSGRKYEIQFDGIFRDSKIWINGFYLGNNASGYSGVTYDVTDYLIYDRDNVITVRVDATQYEGWFYEGAGIYRHVWLNTYNNLHFAANGLFVYSTNKNSTATIAVEATITNQQATAENCKLAVYILDRTGKPVAKTGAQPVALKGYETRMVKQQVILQHPILWSTEAPYLYRIIPVITQGNATIDSEVIRHGIRSIKIDATGLYVNGQYTKVKGVNCHQDHAGVGSALPDDLQYYRIQLLKAMGVNAYRTSHNAPTPELLDACDSLGLLVMDENRLLNSSPEYMSQLERLICRDRNHASVFLWSIGNEEGYVQTSSTGKRIAQTLLARQKELDPTRTSTYAADVANIFKGVNEVIPVRGFNYRILGVDPYHNDHPTQPIIGTEMGSTVTTRGIYTKDTITGYLPDEDLTAPWWANTAEQWWALAADRPWWIGGFIWTGFDYRGEPTPFQWPNINSHFGIMDMCGFPKNIYYYYQSWWTNNDVLHISPHWNWKGQEGKPVTVWVNSNAEMVELFLNGKSVGKKEMLRNRHLEWNVPYEPGVLQAVAYKQGKKITAAVETTGDAYKIVVTPNKTIFQANGTDAGIMNITVVDKQGREVPDASNAISFSITGDMTIIGVGNGDPSSHEPDKCVDGAWQRCLFNGKCQVIVQAGKRSGMATFQATAAGLLPQKTEIQTVPLLR
jgi:beta-galactosidase